MRKVFNSICSVFRPASPNKTMGTVGQPINKTKPNSSANVNPFYSIDFLKLKGYYEKLQTNTADDIQTQLDQYPESQTFNALTSHLLEITLEKQISLDDVVRQFNSECKLIGYLDCYQAQQKLLDHLNREDPRGCLYTRK